MKVIFLDIDGVLNNQKHTVELCDNLLGREQYYEIMREIGEIPFDYRSCKLIQQLAMETGAKIVLYSTWRLNPASIDILSKYAKIEIYDKTPCISVSYSRGLEIQQWLENHPMVTNYVIIDDDMDMLESQMSHFVHIDNMIGFIKENLVQCKEILNREE